MVNHPLMSKRRIAVLGITRLEKLTRLLESKLRQADVIGRNIKRHRRPHLGLSHGLCVVGLFPRLARAHASWHPSLSFSRRSGRLRGWPTA